MHGLSCPAAFGILVPQPGIEPVIPALQGEFLTTGLPGKSLYHILDSTYVISHGICLSVFDLLHLICLSLGPFMLLQMALFHLFIT